MSDLQGAEWLPAHPLSRARVAGAGASTPDFHQELPQQGLLVCAEPKVPGGQVVGLQSFLLQPPGDPRGLWGQVCPSQSHKSCSFSS